MEKSDLAEQVVRCSKCKKVLTSFMAYIPGEGDVCLKCFSEYAQEQENQPIPSPRK